MGGPKTSSIQSLDEGIMYHIKSEKIRYTIRGSARKCYDIWEPFLTFVEDIDADNMVL